jgi:major membrane immunogen (membrane-anchored lipoprotein)
MAIRMFNLKGKGSDQYFKEVEDKLIEETNYIGIETKPRSCCMQENR